MSPTSDLSVYELLLSSFPGHWLWSLLYFSLSSAPDESKVLRMKERKSEKVCGLLDDRQGNYD